MSDISAKVGYLELLRSNRDYRNIWIADVTSLLGDWFNTIALYTLVQRLTGSSLALGLVFIAKMLPFALASPLAGVLSDRFDRRRLMILADLVRAAAVLGFLAVEDAADMPLLYALIAVQMAVGAVFIPARSASIPNLASDRELLTANALSAATWSTLLALGAALGGFATAGLGTDVVFAVDSATYVLSAFFIFRTRIPQDTAPRTGGSLLTAALGDLADGWRLLRREAPIRRIALTKPAWAVGGSGLVFMLALVGEEMMPAAPAVGIGLLYACRGLGTGAGPIAARALLPDERTWPTMIGWGIVASGLAYALLGSLPWSLLTFGLVVAAHTPSGANWVLSTVLLQRRTADRYRGRVFATEWLLVTGVDAAGIAAASLLLEHEVLTLRGAIVLFALLQVTCGLLWRLTVVPRERREPRLEAPGELPAAARSAGLLSDGPEGG